MKTFKETLIEKKTDEEQTDLDILILTGSQSEDENVVTGMFLQSAEELKQKCHKVIVGKAWVSDFDLDLNTMTIMNYEDTGKRLEIQTARTMVVVRAGAIDNDLGKALIRSFQESGCFMVNDLESMRVCDNKFSSYITFSRHNIPIPRTSLLPTDKAIDHAHKHIGGKFPVVIKTLSGTQGIGVSIVNDLPSMVSVVQSLRKFDAKLLIQEYLDIDFDIRTIVVSGRIIASTKRNRVKKDFRSNAHLGAKTEPYILSDNEQEVIKAAARSVGGILVGVDHCIQDGKLFILECNASPGLGSNFHNYDITTVPQKPKKDDITGDGKTIVKEIINHFRWPRHRRLSFFTECGYLERLKIKGVGEFRAKMDTGNGTKATMKEVDKLVVDGQVVKWELNGKKFENKLKGWSVPQHTKVIDKRPIIHMEVEFNNRTYINIPFGLTTADSKSECLVNRDLMTIFKVVVNPNRAFILSDFIERDDSDDV